MDLQVFIVKLIQLAPGLLLAVVFHEYAHGWMAKRFGDDTAEKAGRLTLNPIPHIDLMGTIIVPSVLLLFFNGLFGWAKPVPVRPRNFSDINKGQFWVSFAGPIANFLLATASAFLLALCSVSYTHLTLPTKRIV